MPKAREAYRGQRSFGDNEPCKACGKRPSTKNVCRSCNEVGCGYCLPVGKRCTECGDADVHNLQASDIR